MNLFNEEENILMEAALVQLVEINNPVRKQYTVRPRAHHMNEWDEQEFIRRFRLSKNSVQNILEEIQHRLVHRMNKYVIIQLFLLGILS